MFDQIYGIDLAEEHYAKAIEDLSKFIAKNGRDAKGFKFANAEGVGLKDVTYERADEAAAALHDFATPGANPIVQKELDLFVGELRRIGTLPNGPAYGYIEAIPEHVSVRFYKRRMLTNLPVKASIINAHGVYMNAVLKGAHMDPFLAEIVPILHRFNKTKPEEIALATTFIDQIIGNPTRMNKDSMAEMGRLMGFMYQGTLLGNLSATMANYLGQTGFILAA